MCSSRGLRVVHVYISEQSHMWFSSRSIKSTLICTYMFQQTHTHTHTELQTHTAFLTITKQESQCFNLHKSCLLNCFMCIQVDQLREHEFISCQWTAFGGAGPGNFHSILYHVNKKGSQHDKPTWEPWSWRSRQLDTWYQLPRHFSQYWSHIAFCVSLPTIVNQQWHS